MLLAEKPVELDGAVLSGDQAAHQKGPPDQRVDDPSQTIDPQVALYMFSRWSQENFFRNIR